MNSNQNEFIKDEGQIAIVAEFKPNKWRQYERRKKWN